MTTTWNGVQGAAGSGGGLYPLLANAKLAPKHPDAVLRKLGKVATVQNLSNGFNLMRQHHDHYTNRPAPSLSRGYPSGLWEQSVGAELDGYGAGDSGGGSYINLSRNVEGAIYTQHWMMAIKTPRDGGVGKITLYKDTEGLGSLLRSYFAVEVNLATGEVKIRNDTQGYTVVGTVQLPGWNDQKYNFFYWNLSTYLGHSDQTGEQFGSYIQTQFVDQVIDLRNKGGGSANYPTQLALTGSSFGGGCNSGNSYDTPLPGVSGGLVIQDYCETIGDEIV